LKKNKSTDEYVGLNEIKVEKNKSSADYLGMSEFMDENNYFPDEHVGQNDNKVEKSKSFDEYASLMDVKLLQENVEKKQNEVTKKPSQDFVEYSSFSQVGGNGNDSVTPDKIAKNEDESKQ